MTSLDQINRFETVTVAIANGAITIERTGRGSFATVTSGRFNGEQVFASTPSIAFGILMDKLMSKMSAEIARLSN